MELNVIGGGLAGCEAAWQAAEQGIHVNLFEMRPIQSTGAHRTGKLAELVCSNSLGSNLPNRPSGLLKDELRRLSSLLIRCADASSLPAGGALAVDREVFSDHVEKNIESHPKIQVIRKEVTDIPEGPAILATGPLTSSRLSESLIAFTSETFLYFFDAIAPIIEKESIDMTIAFRANRYGRGESEVGDYINCPMDKTVYDAFRLALIKAKRIKLSQLDKDVDQGVDTGLDNFFQGCQPIEVIAGRGEKSLAFGPLRPVGLTHPGTNQRSYAVVQLRQDNLIGDSYNMVGFQTNLTFSEQKRVFRMIPGLEGAVFVRYGQMHRNTFLAAPKLLSNNLSFKQRPDLFVAGQLAGIEGYAGNIASGLFAGLNAARLIKKKPQMVFPETTMVGALINYITHADMKMFQPMKAIFGLLPKPKDENRRSKSDRYAYYVNRAHQDLENYLSENEYLS